MNLKAFKYGTTVHKSRFSLSTNNNDFEIAVLQYNNKYYFYFGILKKSSNCYGLIEMKKVKSLTEAEAMYNDMKQNKRNE